MTDGEALWAHRISLSVRILGRLVFWAVVAMLFLAAICWFFVSAVVAGSSGGHR